VLPVFFSGYLGQGGFTSLLGCLLVLPIHILFLSLENAFLCLFFFSYFKSSFLQLLHLLMKVRLSVTDLYLRMFHNHSVMEASVGVVNVVGSLQSRYLGRDSAHLAHKHGQLFLLPIFLSVIFCDLSLLGKDGLLSFYLLNSLFKLLFLLLELSLPLDSRLSSDSRSLLVLDRLLLPL
jgi:hypothetical protein